MTLDKLQKEYKAKINMLSFLEDDLEYHKNVLIVEKYQEELASLLRQLNELKAYKRIEKTYSFKLDGFAIEVIYRMQSCNAANKWYDMPYLMIVIKNTKDANIYMTIKLDYTLLECDNKSPGGWKSVKGFRLLMDFDIEDEDIYKVAHKVLMDNGYILNCVLKDMIVEMDEAIERSGKK